MRIAVVGSGFGGSSIAYHVLNNAFAGCRSPAVTLLHKGNGDKHRAACASLVSGGLLHPFTGPRASPSCETMECFRDAAVFLETIQALSSVSFAKRTELLKIVPMWRLRPAKRVEQNSLFKDAAKRHPASLLYLESVKDWIPDMQMDCPGILVRDAFSVNAPKYLRALHRVLQSQGCTFKEESICSITNLSNTHDHVFVACGSGFTGIAELARLSAELKLIKGQTVFWTERHVKQGSSPSIPVFARFYLHEAPFADDTEEGMRLMIGGSTYEEVDSLVASYEPQENSSTRELQHSLKIMHPEYSRIPETAKIWKSGVRVAHRTSHLPLCGRLEGPLSNVSYLVGFGSRGLLYHSSWGRKVVAEAFSTK
eukprot:ANDGO_05586.mRNA.1 hypothetical protein